MIAKVSDQNGTVLAIGLVFLLLTIMLSTWSMSNAIMESFKTGAIRAANEAFYAAENGISDAIERWPFAATVDSVMPSIDFGSGIGAAASIRFLGVGRLSDRDLAGGLVAYHFIIEAQGWSTNSARSRHRAHVIVAAPPPTDPAICVLTGCQIAPLCVGPDEPCDAFLRAAPVTVSWHAAEEA